MSLDQNLFTLHITPSEVSPPDIDLTDPAISDVLYRKKRAAEQSDVQSAYKWSLHDPLSGAIFCTVSSPHSTSKKKTITLHDPDVPVELSFSGSITFKWSFMWESHEFEWKKEECYMVRKPDPPVLIAVSKPEHKGKPASVQILDYNLNRFDINDRKGLEIVVLCGLLTFADYAEGYRELANGKSATTASPPPPVSILVSKPRPNFSPYQRNEIIVTDEGSIDDYAQHCASIIAVPDLLFIIIRAGSADHVSKVVKVAQETKRRRRRDANDDDEELNQYVSYDQEDKEGSKGKKSLRVINLDDASDANTRKAAYKPPTSLTIHLSKIPMPELIPKTPHTSSVSPQSRNPNHNNILRDAATSNAHSNESSSRLRGSPPEQNRQVQRPLSALSLSVPRGPPSPPQDGARTLPRATSSQNLRLDPAGDTLVPASTFSRRVVSGSPRAPSPAPNGLHPGAQAYYNPQDFGGLGGSNLMSANAPAPQTSPAGSFLGKVLGKP